MATLLAVVWGCKSVLSTRVLARAAKGLVERERVRIATSVLVSAGCGALRRLSGTVRHPPSIVGGGFVSVQGGGPGSWLSGVVRPGEGNGAGTPGSGPCTPGGGASTPGGGSSSVAGGVHPASGCL